jgi:hypothetical protein
MTSSPRVQLDAETTRFPHPAPAYCAVAAVAVLLPAGISARTAAALKPDALSHSSEQPVPDQRATPELPTTPLPEAAPSATSTPIGLDLSITPTVAKPDTGAVGSGEVAPSSVLWLLPAMVRMSCGAPTSAAS